MAIKKTDVYKLDSFLKGGYYRGEQELHRFFTLDYNFN